MKLLVFVDGYDNCPIACGGWRNIDLLMEIDFIGGAKQMMSRGWVDIGSRMILII